MIDTLAERLAAHREWLERGAVGDGRLVERGAALAGVSIRYADLRYADLRGADLSEADLRRSNLRGADLSGSDLRRSNLRGADLSGSDLRRSNLSGADLRWSNLSGSDLRWSNLSGADLRGADLSGAAGVRWWSIGWHGNGERGRTLLAVDHGSEGVIVHCGCFRGSIDELDGWIAEQDEPARIASSRRRAARILRELIGEVAP